MPGYAPTPLVDLAGLAGFLGMDRLWVKDESRRFGLNAFKVLGASYAIGKLVAGRLGIDPSSFRFQDLEADAFSICEDDVARRGMRVLGNPLEGDERVVSGESGAVTAGMLFELCTHPRLEDVRRSMGLWAGSRVFPGSNRYGKLNSRRRRKCI